MHILILIAFFALALATFCAGTLTATTTAAEREEMGVRL